MLKNYIEIEYLLKYIIFNKYLICMEIYKKDI